MLYSCTDMVTVGVKWLTNPLLASFIIIIITKIYIAHYRIAPNALTVSVRSSE